MGWEVGPRRELLSDTESVEPGTFAERLSSEQRCDMTMLSWELVIDPKPEERDTFLIESSELAFGADLCI